MTVEFIDSSFEGAQVVLDDMSYVRCTFRRCQIVYRGGVFHLDGCVFQDSGFQFEGAAGNTIAFLRAMNEIPGGAELFESIFPMAGRPRGALH